MKPLRFAIFGCGFWSRFQLAGWKELPGAECVALYNRTRAKAEKLAAEFGVPAVYDDPEQLLAKEKLDFIDIITDVDTHSRFVHLAARHRLPVICQKPMAPTLSEAQRMVTACEKASVPLFVHENWRWQAPIRRFKRMLEEGRIGQPFRARIQYCSSFPVFDNQPFLKDLEQFILTDMGSHILDVARFLFGEARSLYCHTHRVHADIRGEDVATIMLQMDSGATVVCDISYASRLEREKFPETFILAEGPRGSLELAGDFWIRQTTAEGTLARRYPPPRYAWADPACDVVFSSIPACNANILSALQAQGCAETTGRDNLETVRLIFAAYDSAARNKVVHLD